MLVTHAISNNLRISATATCPSNFSMLVFTGDTYQSTKGGK